MRSVNRIVVRVVFSVLTAISTMAAGPGGGTATAMPLPGRDRWYRETILRKAPGGGTNCHVFGSDAAEGRVYASCRGRIYVLDGETGVSVWEFATGGATMKQAGFVMGGALADAIKGLDTSIIRPLLTRDAVISASGFRRELVSLARADGHLLWSITSPDDLHAPPVLVGTAICIAGGSLVCVNASSGSRLWEAELTEKDVRVRPAFSGDRLWIASRGGNLLSFDPATGRAVWRGKLKGDIAAITPISGGRIAVMLAHGSSPKSGGEIVVLDRDGVEQFRYPIGSVTAAPVYVGALLCHAEAAGAVACREADNGRLRWSATANGEPVQSSPVPYGDGLLLLDRLGRLRLLSLADGAMQWTRRACYSPDGSPVPANSAIYCGCAEGVEAMLWPEPPPAP